MQSAIPDAEHRTPAIKSSTREETHSAVFGCARCTRSPCAEHTARRHLHATSLYSRCSLQDVHCSTPTPRCGRERGTRSAPPLRERRRLPPGCRTAPRTRAAGARPAAKVAAAIHRAKGACTGDTTTHHQRGPQTRHHRRAPPPPPLLRCERGFGACLASPHLSSSCPLL